MELKLLILILASVLPQPEPPTCEESGGQRVLWRMDHVKPNAQTVMKVPVYKCAYLVDLD
jgi:hypothetical protein